jgi:glycosyltransferase involved in cell wall biosynthesis
MLTILIPNWNRPRKLEKTLESIYESLSAINTPETVKVLVVDDFSTDPAVSKVAKKYSAQNNFKFVLQNSKCGNAEIAFLSSLVHVETQYLWLFGNDDLMLKDGVSTVLQLLASRDDVGMILLNPLIYSPMHNKSFSPISASSALLEYDTCKEMFENWGFVTSTTTFSCLILMSDPIKKFHKEKQLSRYATVYSHTFSSFCALGKLPALFYSKPITRFTLNRHDEEQDKLAKQASTGVEFHHHTIGLSRLINACSEISGISIKIILLSFEDEIDKVSLSVVPGTLLSFLAHFFLEQLIREVINTNFFRPGFSYLSKDEIELIISTIYASKDNTVSRSIRHSMLIYASSSISSKLKTKLIREIQNKLRKYSSELRELDPDVTYTSSLPTTPLKLTTRPPKVLPFKNGRPILKILRNE